MGFEAVEPAEEACSQMHGPTPDSMYAPSRIWTRLDALMRALSLNIPLAFLGLGIYRAWTVVVLNAGFFDTSGLPIGSRTLFDIVMLIGFLLLVLFSRRIGSICLRPGSPFLSMFLLVVSTLAAEGALLTNQPLLATWFIIVFGGTGLVTIILQWSEIYSALCPSRICLYYAASVAVGQLVGFVFSCFKENWSLVISAFLPYISYRCMFSCMNFHGAGPRSDATAVRHTFPWKPVLVVALCTFSFCLVDNRGAEMSIPGISLGTLAGSAAVVLLFWALRDHIDTDMVYGVILPFASAALLLFSTVDELGWWCGFFARFGYSVGQVFVFTMLGAICYHWGTNPLWLFGIERLVRTFAQIIGRGAASFAAMLSLPTTPVVFVSVLVVTFLILGERRLDSTWGVELSDIQSDPDKTNKIKRHNELIQACARLATNYGLSQREEEVLILLAQHKTAHDIEEALCIANGTAKAHIRHVYQKLDIHTREELFGLTGHGKGAALTKPPRLNDSIDYSNSKGA